MDTEMSRADTFEAIVGLIEKVEHIHPAIIRKALPLIRGPMDKCGDTSPALGRIRQDSGAASVNTIQRIWKAYDVELERLGKNYDWLDEEEVEEVEEDFRTQRVDPAYDTPESVAMVDGLQIREFDDTKPEAVVRSVFLPDGTVHHYQFTSDGKVFRRTLLDDGTVGEWVDLVPARKKPVDELIEITLRDHGDAYAEGANPARYKATAKKGEVLVGFGTGRTVDAAIGDVVRSNPEHFNIKIADEKRGGLHKGELNVFIGKSKK